MAGPAAGKTAYLALGSATASTTPKSIQGADATLNNEQNDVDVTVWSTAAVESSLPSFKRGTISFSGPWSSTKDTHLSGILGTTGIEFAYGPGGGTTGKVKKTGTGYLRSYEIRSPVGDAVTFSAEFKISSVITSTVF